MIPKECKRLAEVDFPIAEVSKHAAREKSIRHGLPSTLHLWWARRPLAACRAVLLSLLWPDPCDPNCPEGFKQKARHLLPSVQGQVGPSDEQLQKALLRFIGDFASWELARNHRYLEIARALAKAAHGEGLPLVVDPFAGGGAIPLEALRLGCETFASDLNPVACLILKVMLEDIPRQGPELAEELRQVGTEIKQKAESELATLYPKDADGATPITYIWARTVKCESPKCGAEIPLLRSFWLCKKEKRKRALQYRIIRSHNDVPRVEFEVFEPTNDKDVPGGTVTRAKARCLNPECGAVLAPDRVRAQLAEQRGGADVVFDISGRRTGGALLLAVAVLRPEEAGRTYRLAGERDYQAIFRAQEQVREILAKWEQGGRKGLCPVPDEPTPVGGGTGAGRAFSIQKYGMFRWGDMFTARQKVALVQFASLISHRSGHAKSLCLALGKMTDLANAFCPWEPVAECPRQVLNQGRIKPAWDFAEGVTISESSGGFVTCLDNFIAGALSVGDVAPNGQVAVAAAQTSPLPEESASVWFTDPPYYDAIPYACLSDFFFVWFKRAMPNEPLLGDPFDSTNPLTPKLLETIYDETQRGNGGMKDKAFFEASMAEAFRVGRLRLRESGIGCVVFAHKTTEGWEALLSGIIKGGWTITGSWPIATEMAHRLRARESAALATSVHLICRPRPGNAPVGDWAAVLRELPNRVGDWMERLQSEGVRGADLVFACIGPALEIFSRYSRVETADGREVKLAEYLEKVWEVVGRSALEQVLGTAEAKARNGAAGAVEEDARLTALFLWTLQSTNGESAGTETEESDENVPAEDRDEEETSSGKAKGYALVFDVVRRFAQPLGINLPKWEGRIIETKKGIVRLFPVAERARILFGKDGTEAVAQRLEKAPAGGIYQPMLFTESEEETTARGKGRDRGHKKAGGGVLDGALETSREATTLDRVHTAMLLQAGGRANALRALLKAEQERGQDFLRLANALSALYPKGSEEKRLLDAMLLAVPR